MGLNEAFYNCSLNTVGLFLVIIVFVYGRLNGRDHKEQLIFDAIILGNIVLSITDSLSWCCDGATFLYAGPIYAIVQFINYLSSATIVLCWALYCDWRLYGKKRSKVRVHFYMLYWVLYVFILVLNSYYPIFYHIDSSNVYHRDNYYFVFVFYNALSLLASTILILVSAPKRNTVDKRDAYSLILFSLPPLIGAIVQFNCYGISTLPVALAISILFIFVNRLFTLITIDNLTGLNNRRAFERNLRARIQMVDDRELLFLIVMDANGFKSINDTYGHKTGDEALIRISSCLKMACRHGDILARLGGDEFVILGKRKTEREIAESITYIQELLVEDNKDEIYPYKLSLSIGYSIYNPKANYNEISFFQEADNAMYKDKEANHKKGHSRIT